MRLRSFLAALLVAVATACSVPAAPQGAEALLLGLSPDPSPPVTGEEVHWVLEVSNRGDEAVSLHFDTTQRGDVLLSAEGVEVYRWSERRAFSRDIEDITVLPGETVTFPLEDGVLEVGPGEYEVLARLSGFPMPGIVRETVTVGAP